MRITDFGSEKTLNGKEFDVFRDCKTEMKLIFVRSILIYSAVCLIMGKGVGEKMFRKKLFAKKI